MKEVEAWKLGFYDKVYDNIDDIIRGITNDEIVSFQVKDKYIPGQPITSYIEKIADEKNYAILYTDDIHPFVLSNNSFSNNIINPIFFNKHKDILVKTLINKIKSSDNNYFTIYDYLYSEELLDYLLNIKDVTITFVDIDLDSKTIQKIKDKHIDSFIEKKGDRKQISSRYIFGLYTYEQLEQQDDLYLNIDEIDDIDASLLKYINNSCVINFVVYNNDIDYHKILEFVEKLDSIGNKNIVKIKVDKRSTFNNVFLDKEFNNVNIVIHNDLYDYSFNEYKDEERRLDEIIKPIKDKDFSPLEKYIAVYNIVKNYKKYKENVNQKDESRYLRYILDNEYMVCVGFAKLLEVLCDKVGVDVKGLSVAVDVSYDKGYTQEEKIVTDEGHARSIVNIDDDKYNIHGLYVSDPTWDNGLEENRLNNVLMTFDKMDVSKRMFYYSRYDPILDIHNFKEFNEQINYLLRREINDNSFIQNKSFIEKLLYVYKTVIESVLNTISCDPKYMYFMNKLKDCAKEKDYEKLLTELGNYLLDRINKKVDDEVIIKAAIYTDKVLGKESNIDDLRKSYYELDKLSFPYEIDNENDHNLIGRSK